MEIFGKYELLTRLGVGGMAEVFLAGQSGPAGFKKQLVIKRILPSYADDEKFITMFLDEARLVARLHHPNIVQIFELGEIDGRYYIAMEYVNGKALSQIVDQNKKYDIQIPFNYAAKLISEVCAGLEYAHSFRDEEGNAFNLVHRDVTPENVLVSFTGPVKIIDFGVAKARSNLFKTQAGAIKGKLSYMSPEQIRGKPIDKRSDLFSLGIVLFELCTGHRPFGGEVDLSAVSDILSQAPKRPEDFVVNFPPLLTKIIFKALEKNHDDRYQNSGEMQADLEDFIHKCGKYVSSGAIGEYITRLFKNTPEDQEYIRSIITKSQEHLQHSIDESLQRSGLTNSPLLTGPRESQNQYQAGVLPGVRATPSVPSMPEAGSQRPAYEEPTKALNLNELRQSQQDAPAPARVATLDMTQMPRASMQSLDPSAIVGAHSSPSAPGLQSATTDPSMPSSPAFPTIPPMSQAATTRKSSGGALKWMLLVLILLGGGSAGGYFLYQHFSKSKGDDTKTTTTAAADTKTVANVADASRGPAPGPDVSVVTVVRDVWSAPEPDLMVAYVPDVAGPHGWRDISPLWPSVPDLAVNAAPEVGEAPLPLDTHVPEGPDDVSQQYHPETPDAHVPSVPDITEPWTPDLQHPPGQMAVLTITTVPETSVYHGRQNLGRTPLTTTLPPGVYDLRLRAAGLSFKLRATLAVGTPFVFSKTFQRAYITAFGAYNATIFIDGRFVSSNGRVVQHPVWEGSHSVQFRHSYYGTQRVRVTLRSGQTKTVQMRFDRNRQRYPGNGGGGGGGG